MEPELKKLEIMHSLYGRRDREVCRRCKHFCKLRPGKKNLYKCRVYGITQSEATDWRLSYKACGMFNMELPDGFETVMDRKKSRKLDCHAESLPPIQLDGQMNIFVDRSLNGNGNS